MSTRNIRWLALLAALALLAMTPAAFAAGPPPGKGGGGGHETTLGNNLSVPTIFVGSVPSTPAVREATTAAPDQLVAPAGPQSTVFPGFWLQKTEASWRSMYRVAGGPDEMVPATANWSDNLTKHQWSARQPIRVEMVLYDPDEVMTGYVITNLTPELPDRSATYGTDGATFTTPAPIGEATVYTRVFAPGAHLSIVRPGDGFVVFDGPMTAEMNSGGAVTYGYNWGIKGAMPVAGDYTLTFSLPVTGFAQIDEIDPLDLNPEVTVASEGEGVLYEPVLVDEFTTSLDITILSR